MAQWGTIISKIVRRSADRRSFGLSSNEKDFYIKAMNRPQTDTDIPSAPDSAEEAGTGETRAEKSTSMRNLLRGAKAIHRFWKTLPSSPGVYRMFDEDGDVLYVGKAKSLKNRVASYTREQGHTNRIARMICETVSMEFVTTETETEALLLEANLIKQLKPRYNVLMRDDKSFPYILLATDHESPQLVKHRGARTRKGYYFGPFANVLSVDRTISTLQRAFLLRSCTDSYFENRTRPCLLFQIKRCSGPCTGEISKDDYDELVREAKDFLSGRSIAVKERLSRDMQAAAATFDYETAARYRDRIAALAAVQGTQDINTQSVEEADVFAIAEQAGHFCVEVFFFRNWQNWGNRAYFPKADKSLSAGDVLNAFMAQFYADKPAARSILISHDIAEAALLAEALTGVSGHKVEIVQPKRGEKLRLMELALRNAKEALGRKLADSAQQERLLAQLTPAFDLPRVPRRIEIYDNSHISGTNAVGAMVTAGANGFMKTHYRTFNIKSGDLTPGDDFGMMREVLLRRFSRLMKEVPWDEAHDEGSEEKEGTDVFPAWPDLVLIDGGKGQVEAARAAMAEAGVPEGAVAIVGVAKGRDRDAGRETFFVSGKSPFKMPPNDPALYFVQRLRDEAHRFAIGTHRNKRRRDMVKNPLDEIPGIGPTRKRALLLHFGTVKAIQRAALDDLMRTPGINAATARTVFDFFRTD